MTRLLALVVLTLAAACGRAGAPPVAAPPPPTARAGPALAAALADVDSLVAGAVAQGLAPGAVLRVAVAGDVLLERAYGVRQLHGDDMRPLAAPPPTEPGTRYDLASLTKVLATTLALMLLVERGDVELDAPVARYLPAFRGGARDSITVRHLLTHTSGLQQWQPIYYHADDANEALARILELPLGWGVGEGRHYSDLGFMLLGYIIEAVSGQPLDAFTRAALYRPLGLDATGFLPLRDGPGAIAATELGNGYEKRMVYDTAFGYRVPDDPRAWDGWREHVLAGEVNDGNAWYAHGGVAGHAGLFSAAAEVGALVDLLLAGGAYRGIRLLAPETVQAFLTRDAHGHFLGWLHPRGGTERTFAHTGFTGTWTAGVPEHGLSVVLLTNRQHMGTDDRGFFPNLAPLQRAILERLTEAAAADAARAL